MKEEKRICPYCGSKKTILVKPPHGALIDPIPNIITIVNNAFNKLYKCEDCGKEFD